MSVPAHWIDSGTPDFFLRCQFKHIRLVQARQTAQGMPDCLLAHQFKHIRLVQTCQTGPRHARLIPGTSIQAYRLAQAHQTRPMHATLPPGTPVQAYRAGPSMPDWAQACQTASWHASSGMSDWPRHARLGPGSRGHGHTRLSTRHVR